MITNAPNDVFLAESALPAGDVRPHGFVAWSLAWFQEALCALHGHDAILQYERNRIYLRCTSCGHETPGWEVATNATTVRHRPVETRKTLASSGDLAVARRIA
jgi:hypothetical protein